MTEKKAVKGEKRYYVYILECGDGTFYTGYTTDPDRRVREHNRGTASRYTRARLPVKLIHLEDYPTRSRAMKREYRIKELTREEKEVLIRGKLHQPGQGEGSVEFPD